MVLIMLLPAKFGKLLRIEKRARLKTSGSPSFTVPKYGLTANIQILHC